MIRLQFGLFDCALGNVIFSCGAISNDDAGKGVATVIASACLRARDDLELAASCALHCGSLMMLVYSHLFWSQ